MAGKGRARSLPDRPHAVWDALPRDVQDGLEAVARELGVPIDRWPEVSELADAALSVATRRQVHILERRDRIRKRAAFRRVAASFGLTEDAVRCAYYAFEGRRRKTLGSPAGNCSRIRDGVGS